MTKKNEKNQPRHCNGCTDRRSEGTHACGTIEHPHTKDCGCMNKPKPQEERMCSPRAQARRQCDRKDSHQRVVNVYHSFPPSQIDQPQEECQHETTTLHGECGSCGKRTPFLGMGHTRDKSCCVQPQEESWEEELQKDLEGTLLGWDELLEEEKDSLVGLVQEYLQKERAKAREEVREMIWESRLIAYSGPHIMAGSEQERAYLEIYNQALQDLLAKLGEMEGKEV